MNIKSIAQELNIGIDAIAFFDDNPAEREEVRMNAPGALVFEDTRIIDALDMVIFEPIGAVTEESAARTQMYKEQAQRAVAEAQIDPANMTAFYKSCQFKLGIEKPTASSISRIEELIQRTNQLNATGNRTTAADLQRFVSDQSKYQVSTASLRDKFGDYGLIGVCVAEKLPSHWNIIEFDFSCRAMGKHVEHAVLTHLCRSAGAADGNKITIHFKKTSRNKEMRSILQNFGFAPLEESEDAVEFAFNLEKKAYPYPEWFEIAEK
jgi:FkbH-like protein